MSEFSYAPPSLRPQEAAELQKESRVGKRIRKRWIFLVVGLLLILAVPVILGVSYAQAVYQPAVPSGENVEIVIAEGATTDQIASNLIDKGLLDEPLYFKIYLRLSGGQSIQAGNFSIPQHISIADLVARLGIAEREQAVLRFTEGWRREEMAEYVDQQYQAGEIIFSGDQFSHLALNPSPSLRQRLGNRLPASASLQGYLFPDTYYIDRDASAEDVLHKMLDTYLAKVTPQMQAGFANEGLTEYEALILAAIVERESYSSEERPIIAEILLKRLRSGEILGTDATLQYALGYIEEEGRWWKQGITMQDLEIDSPYNTRRITGLPPAPICNPGIEAIEAVANPQETPYLYYLHDANGTIYYASTLEEHNANVQKYL